MTYTHGHHESVLRSHTWRTAENSAAYLVPFLRPGQRLLDVGCGPGTITADLALLVAPGEVTGVDAAADVVAQAQEHARGLGVENLHFEVADLFDLGFPDASFDVIHLHQVLQHLADPVAALVELRRVLAPEGVLAARDSDYGAFTWAPADPVLDRWLELYLAVTARNGHDARIGPRLLGHAHEAGFSDVAVSSSTWTYADPEARAWWGGLWADRVRYSRFAEQAVAYGLSDPDELGAHRGGLPRWADSADARLRRHPRRDPGPRLTAATAGAAGRSVRPELVGVGVRAGDGRDEREGGHHGALARGLQLAPVLGDDRLPGHLGRRVEEPQQDRAVVAGLLAGHVTGRVHLERDGREGGHQVGVAPGHQRRQVLRAQPRPQLLVGTTSRRGR